MAATDSNLQLSDLAELPSSDLLRRCDDCGREFPISKNAPHQRFCNRICRDRASWARKSFKQLTGAQLLLPHADFCRPTSNDVREMLTGAHLAKRAAERAAALRAAQEAAEISSKEPVMPRELQIRHLADAMIRDYRINEAKTLPDLLSRWHLHLEPFFAELRVFDVPGNLTVDSPEVRFLVDFENRLALYIDQRQQEKAKNASINRELMALKRMFKLAVQRGRISSAPYIPHLKERNVRKGFLEDREYERLEKVFSSTSPLWMRTLFALAFNFGWRKSELLGLRVRQIDLAGRVIRLDPGTTKNDEARAAVLTDHLLGMVSECVAGKQPEDFVLTRDRDRRGRRSRGRRIAGFRKAWEEAVKSAGMPALLFHDLRRTAVRNMVRCGISERVAMQLSGHKTRSVFDRYHIVCETDLHEAAKKLSEASAKRCQQRIEQSAGAA
jgi:integrase